MAVTWNKETFLKVRPLINRFLGHQSVTSMHRLHKIAFCHSTPPTMTDKVLDVTTGIVELTSRGWDMASLLYEMAGSEVGQLTQDLEKAKGQLSEITALLGMDADSAPGAVEFLMEAGKNLGEMTGLMNAIRGKLGIGSGDDPLVKIKSTLRALEEARAGIADAFTQNISLQAENEALKYAVLGAGGTVDFRDDLSLGEAYVSDGNEDYRLSGNRFAMLSTAAGRTNNEDTTGFMRLPSGREIFVVCDGMGGGNHGKDMSLIATRAYLEARKQGKEMLESVREANIKLQEELRDKYYKKAWEKTGQLPGNEGTTIVALEIDRVKKKIYVISAGDSGAKMVNPAHAFLLTRPHKNQWNNYLNLNPGEPFYPDAQGKYLIPDALADKVNASPGLPRNEIACALGSMNTFSTALHDPLQIDIMEIPFEFSGERTIMLLYSDGLVENQKESELTRLVRENTSGADSIAEYATQAAINFGARDNVTLSVVVTPFTLLLDQVNVNTFTRGGAR